MPKWATWVILITIVALFVVFLVAWILSSFQPS